MKVKLTAGWIAFNLLAASATAVAEAEPSADPVVEWNRTILGIAEAEDGFLTLKGVRTAAMMHLAMHDTLSAIYGKYRPYAYEQSARRAEPVAALVIAAYTIGIDQYPDRKADLEKLRDRWLANVGAEDRDESARLGAAAARTILEKRANDGWDGEAEYHWHPMAPGVYAEFNEHSNTPKGFVFGAGWAAARPFALTSHDQFRAPPPPAIESDEYTNAFNEVKEMGRCQGRSRTADQTHLAFWWKDFAENAQNRLARDLVQRERLGVTDAARLFALLNVDIFDAYVNVFDNKFFYNHWRPYTAIRWADKDGNPDTEAEPSWTNTHRHTYAFPSYPSAHGTACAAAMTVIADTFGDDYAFTMRTPEVDIAGPLSGKMKMHPPTRHFDSPTDAAMECAMSRVYLGIHFRYDSTAGVDLGNRIGRFVVNNYLERQTATTATDH